MLDARLAAGNPLSISLSHHPLSMCDTIQLSLQFSAAISRLELVIQCSYADAYMSILTHGTQAGKRQKTDAHRRKHAA